MKNSRSGWLRWTSCGPRRTVPAATEDLQALILGVCASQTAEKAVGYVHRRYTETAHGMPLMALGSFFCMCCQHKSARHTILLQGTIHYYSQKNGTIPFQQSKLLCFTPHDLKRIEGGNCGKSDKFSSESYATWL